MQQQSNAMTSAILSVAEAILALEAADDRAIAELGKLIATTAEARVSSGLAYRTGQQPLEALQAHFAYRLAGRRVVAEIHGTLGRIAAEQGDSPETWGPSWPCPKGTRTNNPVVPLSKAA